MRKTHQKAVSMLLNHEYGSAGKNDCVMSSIWYYHDNAIARITSETVEVNWCGWYTPSTTERLRALCSVLGVTLPSKQKGWIIVETL